MRFITTFIIAFLVLILGVSTLAWVILGVTYVVTNLFAALPFLEPFAPVLFIIGLLAFVFACITQEFSEGD